jgi:hypothetical protein
MTRDPVRRPSTVAGVVALAVVAFVVNDASVTYGTLAFGAAAGGGVLAVATGLAAREEPLAVFAASVLAPVGGTAVLAVAVVSAADLPVLEGLLDPFVLVALAVAAFGAVAAFTGGVGGGAVGRAFSVVAATVVMPVIVGVLAVAARVGATSGVVDGLPSVVGGILGLVVSPTGSTIDVVVFFVVLAGSARALAAGVSAAPIVELAPRSRRGGAERASDLAVVACLSVWRLFAVGWLVAFGALVVGIGPRLVAGVPEPLVSLVGALASSGAVRIALLALAALSLGVYGALRVGRLATGGQRDTLRRVAPTAGGGVLAATVGFALSGRLVRTATDTVPSQVAGVVARAADVFGAPALALTALVVPMIVLAGSLLAFAALGRLRAIPQRGAPAAVASGGLVLAAAFAGIQGASPGFVFGLVVAAMVAWDVGEYGVGIAAEVGRRAPTARVELVHGAASVGVGVVAYYGARQLYGLTAGLSAPNAAGGLVAFAAAGVGVAALVAALAD